MAKQQITISQFIDQILCHFSVGQFELANALCRELLTRPGIGGQDGAWLALIADLSEMRLKPDEQRNTDELAGKLGQLHFQSLLSASLSQRQKKIELALQGHFGKIDGTPISTTPLLIINAGNIRFGNGVQFGYPFSAQFLSSYVYLNVRHPNGGISIGDGTTINNGATLISEWPDGVGISIGSRNLIGVNLKIYDSDFHGITRRNRAETARAPVRIGDECFLGDNVTILKGVTIGSGVTIAGGAVVTGDIPDDVLIAGAPAKVIRKLT